MPSPPRMIEHAGKVKSIEWWAAETKIPIATIRSRLDKQGWSVAKALTTPVERRFSRKAKRLPSNMPRPCPRPKRHKTGQLFVRWYDNGKIHDRYFGKYGTAEAAAAYERFQLEWSQTRGRAVTATTSVGVKPVVADLCCAFLEHAKGYYVKNGEPTRSFSRVRNVARYLQPFATTPVDEYTPARHREFIASLVATGNLSRKVCNQYAATAVQIFRWGVAHDIVPPDVVGRLAAVEKLQAGRTTAKDRPKVRSVPDEHIEAVLNYLVGRRDERLWTDMIRLQLLTGMRPGEVCSIHTDDVTEVSDLMKYTPDRHKTMHRGHSRTVWIGPQGAEIVRRRWPESPDFLFRYSHGGPISTNGYYQAVQRFCKAAGVPPWHVHRLRHNRATLIAERYESDEALRHAIGDTPAVANAVYVDNPGQNIAMKIARETG